MNYMYVHIEITLIARFIFAVTTVDAHSFMYCLYVCTKTILLRIFVFTLIADIPQSIMFQLYMLIGLLYDGKFCNLGGFEGI